MTEYGDADLIEEQETYGELVIEHYGWGYDGSLKAETREVDYHECTDEELGYEQGPNTAIYPIFESSLSEVQTYRKKFKCIDKKDLIIWGDYNS